MNAVQLILFLGGPALAAIAVAMIERRRRERRRRRLLATPLPQSRIEILERNLPPYAWLREEELRGYYRTDRLVWEEAR